VSAPAATVLERIVAETRTEVERRKSSGPAPAGSQRRAGAPSLGEALRAPGIGVIAEFKRHSPSAGELRAGARVEEVVPAYAAGGAAAVSVLTEEANFGGSLADLEAARTACGLPLLRKDFVVDPYQLQEALAAGADAVLLIVAALSDPQLALLYERARELGLEVLVEVHDREELERALALGAEIVGINNRDLRDFSVDVGRTARLLDQIPPKVTVVSESGIGAAAQLAELERAGVHAVLVGESLMRAADPAAALRELTRF
jgi:indole-3-glycerol phosphate synthase